MSLIFMVLYKYLLIKKDENVPFVLVPTQIIL